MPRIGRDLCHKQKSPPLNHAAIAQFAARRLSPLWGSTISLGMISPFVGQALNGNQGNQVSFALAIQTGRKSG